MTDEAKAGIACGLWIVALCIGGAIGGTFGFVVFLLLTALLIESVIAVDRKERSGLPERKTMKKCSHAQLEELRKEEEKEEPEMLIESDAITDIGMFEWQCIRQYKAQLEELRKEGIDT